MSVSTEEIKNRLRLGEDSYWEFKQIEFRGDRPVSPRRDDLADEIAAFANTEGGTLLCGVTDEGSVQGVSHEQMDALELLLVEICSDSIAPSLAVRIMRREVDGKALLLVEIPAGHSQHDSPGGSFHRIGSSKRRMTSDERLRLAQRRGQARFLWFDEQPVPGTGIGTLEAALWEPLLGAAGRADPRIGLTKIGLLAEGPNGARQATVARYPALLSKPPGLAAQRVHHGDAISWGGPRLRSGRCPGNRRSAATPDPRSGGIRHT